MENENSGKSSDNNMDKVQSLFRNLSADDPDPEITEIESLCLRCGENGSTRLLLTKIPFYKEVVVMSFNCSHCHWENNELQPAAIIQEKGVQYDLKVTSLNDLSRQVVKTEWASIFIPELEFEIPCQSQEGSVTTIEGILKRAFDGLNEKHQFMKAADPDTKNKLEDFLENLSQLLKGDTQFHFILRDCSGNSFIENIFAPKIDPNLVITMFERDREENLLLCITSPDDETSNSNEDNSAPDVVEQELKNEVLQFPTNCSSCHAPCITNMKVTHIPHFRDVVLMATVCDACGHKTNEVKSNSGIQDSGTKISISLTDKRHLTRDVLKSDTCSILIPEIELDVGPAAICARYTTVEGLIIAIKEQLIENNPLIVGDSAEPEVRNKMQAFLDKLGKISKGELAATLILDDPCGNSYLQNMENSDEEIIVEKYKRTVEQNDELGLNDMKVENYEKS